MEWPHVCASVARLIGFSVPSKDHPGKHLANRKGPKDRREALPLPLRSLKYPSRVGGQGLSAFDGLSLKSHPR